MLTPTVLKDTIKNHRVFKMAKHNADQWIDSPSKLNQLIKAATVKALKKRLGPFKDISGAFMSSLRLIQAYAAGRYQAIPKRSLIALVTGVAYFVIPTDAIPDFVAGFGLLDDVALLGWILKSLKTDLEKFQQWEMGQREMGQQEGQAQQVEIINKPEKKPS
jgi:uncharacterized membrane protein YkvA (DUF1232 family)